LTIYEAASVFEGRPYNVLAAIIAILGGLAGALGAYYGRRALFPQKRRLDVTMTIPGSIIARAQEQLGDVSVLLNGTPIVDPHIATLTIENTGSQDISTEQFDNGRPVICDLFAEIVSLRRLDSDGASPAWSANGTKIVLGPDLIRAGQRITFQVLTVHAPSPQSVESYLADTEVKLTLARPAPYLTPADQIRERIQLYRSLKVALWLITAVLLLSCCAPPFFKSSG
jgi:hypothetical protein